MDVNRYYKTGELPENEVDRELFLDLIEKGEIWPYPFLDVVFDIILWIISKFVRP